MPGLSGLSGLSGVSGLFGGEDIPLTIDGLQLWLKADTGTFQDSGKTSVAVNDGDVIGTWEDQSGNGNDAMQATTANKPLLRLSILNSRSVIRFDGVNDNLKTLAFSSDLAQPNTIFLVGEMRNLEGDAGYFFDGIVVTKRHVLLTDVAGTPDDYFLFAGSNFLPGIPFPKSTFHIWSLIFDGATSILYTDSVNLATGDAGSQALSGLTIGDRFDGDPLDGDISEILIYNSVLSDIDRQAIETYLNERYVIF